MIKKTSEGAPPISDSETRVINAISAEQKEKVKKEKNVIELSLVSMNRNVQRTKKLKKIMKRVLVKCLMLLV
jgi:hypothetical protein